MQNSPARILSEFADDPDFQDLLPLFFASLAEQRRELLAAFESGDSEELARKAHQLKVAGGGYGFPGLSETAQRLEDACQAQDASGIGEGLDDLLTTIDRILPS